MSGEPRARRLFFREAIARALAEEMRADSRVLIVGQDVGAFGGSYREFDGLFAEFGPARVRDAPVAENAMIGLGVGLAAGGFRPLVSVTYMDFLMLGLDPLVNYGAKLRFKSAGRMGAPLVVKTTAGAKGQGVAHSQCIEAWLMSVPGLKVVAPSNPADAYGLMKAALRERGPVVYVDHKKLFPGAGEVPLEEAPTPIGVAKILRAGTDVTLVSHSYMVRIALEAAERLAEAGVSCEVIDLRSLAPLDVETLAASVSRTGTLLTLEEGQLACGVGAEVFARVGERLGPIRAARVGPLPAPVSSNPALEAAVVPDAARVVAAAKTLCARARARTGEPE
ncbi:alpha-ketoacid dehydrogenase subunit beta [Methylocella sp.]|uniref:alpha-ketoacid dehydrogenase subunit beta n=1 Tax=Methylocella sp. TaxID=1978226 RepID=UPI003784A9B3